MTSEIYISHRFRTNTVESKLNHCHQKVYSSAFMKASKLHFAYGLLLIVHLSLLEVGYGLQHVKLASRQQQQQQQQQQKQHYSTIIRSSKHVSMRAPSISKSRWNRKQFMNTLTLFNTNDNKEVEEITFFSPNVELTKVRNRIDSTNNEDDETLSSSSSSINEYSFFDEANIYVRAGSGGQGASTYKKGINGQDTQPDGGDGGKGGDIILQCDSNLNTLAGLTNAWRPNSFGGGGAATTTTTSSSSSNNNSGNTFIQSFRAENGCDGERTFKNGRYAKDVIIRVPPGTIVQEEVEEYDYDPTTKERVVVGTDYVDLGTIYPNNHEFEDESFLIVAKGGAGGEGSGVVGKQGGRGVRRTRRPPMGGERKRLKLTLKIVADVALVGVPNAGKSTFLASVTRAKPKIANYPFTTVIPNLGVWIPPFEQSPSYDSDENSDGAGGSTGLVLCDVPGLIAGAAEGVGLGHAFLRHVERCHVILHLVDATSINPIEDFQMLNQEIVRYGNGKLAQMPQIVVVNKIDVWEDEDNDNEQQQQDELLNDDNANANANANANSNSKTREDWEKGLTTRLNKEELENGLRSVMPHSRLMFMSAKGKSGVDDLMIRMHAFVTKVKAAKSNT